MLVAVIWGFAFVLSRVALDSFSPPELTALRFLIAAIPAVWLGRPVAWSVLMPLGLTLFAGQFLLQFFGIANGMPPGLASIVVQTQAFFTILFAAIALRERPRPRQIAGVAVAFVGLGVIALTIGGDLSAIGFVLTLGSAISWGIGNVLLKRVGAVDVLRLIVWLSLVPPPPALALAIVLDGPAALGIARATWLSVGAVLYLGIVATVFAYGIWGRLLRRYSAATVTPWALLAPIVGAYSSSLVFGERFGSQRLVGMGLVLVGVALSAFSGSPRGVRASA